MKKFLPNAVAVLATSILLASCGNSKKTIATNEQEKNIKFELVKSYEILPQDKECKLYIAFGLIPVRCSCTGLQRNMTFYVKIFKAVDQSPGDSISIDETQCIKFMNKHNYFVLSYQRARYLFQKYIEDQYVFLKYPYIKSKKTKEYYFVCLERGKSHF